MQSHKEAICESLNVETSEFESLDSQDQERLRESVANLTVCMYSSGALSLVFGGVAANQVKTSINVEASQERDVSFDDMPVISGGLGLLTAFVGVACWRALKRISNNVAEQIEEVAENPDDTLSPQDLSKGPKL